MFNLIYPPKPITRRRVARELRIPNTEKGVVSLLGIKEALDKIIEEGACLKQAQLVTRYAHTAISYHADENEVEFNYRVKQHKINMQEFERWKEENADKIAEALEKKKAAAQEKADKDRKEIEYLEQLYGS
jgi:hypothetical protein